MATRFYAPLPTFEGLKGCVLSKVEAAKGDDDATFTLADGRVGRLYHSQDCCEHVSIEDVIGDIADLVGTPILDAREETNAEDPPGHVRPEYDESHTWTFYRLTTIRGTVVIRFLGESNGYYSESVDWSCSESERVVTDDPPTPPAPLRPTRRAFSLDD